MNKHVIKEFPTASGQSYNIISWVDYLQKEEPETHVLIIKDCKTKKPICSFYIRGFIDHNITNAY